MSFNLSLLIRRIEKKDPSTFTIEWGDGKIYDYRLNAVQKACPCVRCLEQRKEGTLSSIDGEVFAVRLYNLGRYALCIEFTQGCSRGVYTFGLLRELGRSSCSS